MHMFIRFSIFSYIFQYFDIETFCHFHWESSKTFRTIAPNFAEEADQSALTQLYWSYVNFFLELRDA